VSDHPKKLIEVALPLDEINAACKADKDRKTGTIRNLHKWFAPMPFPAWRALLYAALIDDPGDEEKRAYHLDLIKRLVANGADLPDPHDVAEAQDNLLRQFPGGVPIVLDPFCGGGSTLVEGQRLGLPTFGSDLNPVPVLITRTITELLPKVYGRQPLHPEDVVRHRAPGVKRTLNAQTVIQTPMLEIANSESVKQYNGYEGLIRDVTYYAERIRSQAWLLLQDNFPSQSGETPIAWLWARTARCPNPACGIETILVTSWWLSRKRNDLAWIEPTVAHGQVTLSVVSGQVAGEAPNSPKTGDGVFACLGCAGVLDGNYLRSEGKAGRLGMIMTAVVTHTSNGRIYRAATSDEQSRAQAIRRDTGEQSIALNSQGQGIRVGLYGMDTWDKLYTPRQEQTLATFADLVAASHSEVASDGGDKDWSDAVTTLLGLLLGKAAQYNSSQNRLVVYEGSSTRFNCAFGRNDLPMIWDFYEANLFGEDGPNWMQFVTTAFSGAEMLPAGNGIAARQDARHVLLDRPALVATDPPYFDAIGYADLSDYFYIWHRRALREVHPDLYATTASPKQGELTAIPSHHGNDKETARRYFIEGFTEVFLNLKKSMADDLPMIVVYASKEQKSGIGEETRWAAILTAMIQADLEITGTWPIHGTGSNRMVGQGTNAVASYVAMVCRARQPLAGVCTLSDFNRMLRRELKPAVEQLQAAGILPVDMAQAAMGPGMQVYSRYRQVLDQSGVPVSVDQALRLINQALTEVLDEQEGELDPHSRFAATLWEKRHWSEAPFGEADQLARPQGISVDDVVRARVAAFSRAGFVTLLGRGDLGRDWSPEVDARPTAWEAVHHLADRLIDGGGVAEAGALMADLGAWRDQAQALVYRLHAIAARKGWTEDQERYNSLIGSWSDLLAEAGRIRDNGGGLF
jgi:putative DNA methylase